MDNCGRSGSAGMEWSLLQLSQRHHSHYSLKYVSGGSSSRNIPTTPSIFWTLEPALAAHMFVLWPMTDLRGEREGAGSAVWERDGR